MVMRVCALRPPLTGKVPSGVAPDCGKTRLVSKPIIGGSLLKPEFLTLALSIRAAGSVCTCKQFVSGATQRLALRCFLCSRYVKDLTIRGIVKPREQARMTRRC
jgi:hypothetical protein